MKKFSDYKDESAIDLWADLLEPITQIIADKEVKKVVASKAPVLVKAKALIKDHKKEVCEILLRIDDTPIDGLNLILRLVDVLSDIEKHEELKSFFGFAAEEQTDTESSGSPMESTEAKEN